MSRLKLIAYDLHGGYWDHGAEIKPAPATRDWMPKFSYWCTPMVIANQYGWDIHCPDEMIVSWDGGESPQSVTIESLNSIALGHFGSGILTFQMPYLFRTPDGWSLHVRGPVNEPRDGISPLEGLVETDMTVETFTMNWKFTRPGTVVFNKGDVICTVLPIERGQLQRFDFVIEPIGSNQELKKELHKWSESRGEWNAGEQSGTKKHGDYTKRIEERSINLSNPDKMK